MRRVLLSLFVLATAVPAVAREAAPGGAALTSQARVEAAIVEAVVQRMGADAQVIVERLEIFSLREAAQIEAVPDPGARTGEVVAFALVGAAQGSRGVVTLGRATAVVQVAVPHVKAARLIVRGEDVDAGDLLAADENVSGVPLRRLPTLSQMTGGHALRNIAAGEIATGAAITATPAVRSGQLVRATTPIAGAEVSAMVVAAQNGELGAVIRVVNRDSRRQLRARVIGEGLVEVIHE